MVFNSGDNAGSVLLSVSLLGEESPTNKVGGINKGKLIEPSLKLPVFIHDFITFLGLGLDEGGGLILLPTRWIDSLVLGRGIKGSTNVGSMDNLLGVIGEDHVSHSMPNVLTDAYKASTTFTGIRGKAGVIHHVVHRIPPCKSKQGADIGGGSRQNFRGSAPIECSRGRKVQNEANIHEGEQPGGRGGTCAVHDCVCHPLDILVLSLGGVLVLLVGFTLPITNHERPEDVLDTATDFHLCTVADKFGGGTTATDHIFKCVDEGTISFQRVYITNGGC